MTSAPAPDRVREPASTAEPVDLAARPGRSLRQRLLGGFVSVATVVAIIGLVIAAFFNPIWIGFEQERAGVSAITGYTPTQVQEVTGSILADLFVGPPDFAVAVRGQPVLDAAERSHMVDVRILVLGFGALVGAALIALAVVVGRNRRRAWAWRAVARGSGALVVVGLTVALAVVFFFDAADLLFHLVFFPQGNFSFDPRTERLTQLFPDQFWEETSLGVAVAGLLLAVAVTLLARRRASRLS